MEQEQPRTLVTVFYEAIVAATRAHAFDKGISLRDTRRLSRIIKDQTKKDVNAEYLAEWRALVDADATEAEIRAIVNVQANLTAARVLKRYRANPEPEPEPSADVDPAAIIYHQIGNGTFKMLGAYGFVKDDRSLTFRFRGSRAANMLKIELTPDDLYRLTFYKVQPRKLKLDTVAVEDGIYCDAVHSTIERVTGLATRMPRIVSAS